MEKERGRPQRRWDDDIRQVAGTTWGRVAIERREWRRLEEAFATWQTDIQNMNKRNMHTQPQPFYIKPIGLDLESSSLAQCGSGLDARAHIYHLYGTDNAITHTKPSCSRAAESEEALTAHEKESLYKI
ncbi:hypothetical protein EVAR_83849_1 [Eumeta japonica]|uniref:Uncharacterized protein n=1 Tax=Eumeta variegata TaxID=151549 RepID=A0A4C1URV8_EUMVA|nr:hypothetical protein EVAR_83849_1 [Eumeta japonica]